MSQQLVFYPNPGDLEAASLRERLDILKTAAEQYKAVILDSKGIDLSDSNRRQAPSDMPYAFNWNELARLLRELREYPEATPVHRNDKAVQLKKLAEIYEVLRGAKMPKLEAVRLAIMNEVNQLGSTSAA